MAVANNADDYTVGRLNIFFPANNQTPQDGNLTGQCVTLVKWFMAEMANVPAPFNARGHARQFAHTLVDQGHAVEVGADQARRGDIVTYEYGLYGHTGILLSGGRLFQQNVNTNGVQRKVVDGEVVYASSIVPIYGSLGGVKPRFYRLKTYVEGGDPMAEPKLNNGDIFNIIPKVWGRPPNTEDYGYANGTWHDFIYGILSAYPYMDREADYADARQKREGYYTVLPIAEQRSVNFQRICDVTGVLREADEQKTTDNIVAEVQRLQANQKLVTDLQKQLADLKAERDKDTETGNSFLRWLGNKIRGN